MLSAVGLCVNRYFFFFVECESELGYIFFAIRLSRMRASCLCVVALG